MKILDRSILKESAGYFAITLLTFTAILLTVRILKLTHLIVNKGVELRQILLVFGSMIPTFLEIAVPMATLMGVMLAFARMSGDSELVVIRASGVSLRKLIKPVIYLAILTALLTAYITLSLRPWGYRTLSHTLFLIARSKSTAGLDQGVFNELGKMTVYMEGIDHRTGTMNKVLIDDRRQETNRKIIVSKQGKLSSDESEETVSITLEDGTIHQEVGGNYTLTQFNSNELTLTADEIYNPDAKKRDKRNRELTTSELRSEIAGETDPKEKNKARIELLRRYSVPVATFFLALIAMPLGVQPARSQKTWGASLSVILGLGVFVLYYGFLTLGIALAESRAVSPYIGLWLPNVFVGVIALYTLKQMSTETWQSIAHGLEGALDWFSAKIDRLGS